MVDLYREGLEGDDALRRLDASTALPQSAAALVVVEDGGQAYRAVRGTDGGGVRIAPAADWGNGITSPLVTYTNPSTASIGRLATIDGWKYPGLLISMSGARTNRTLANPTLVITGRDSTGGIPHVATLPFLADAYHQNWVINCLPTMLDFALYVTTGDTIDNFGFNVHALYPTFNKRTVLSEGFLVKFRTQAVGTTEQVGVFYLPETYRVTLRLDVNAIPTDGALILSLIDRPIWDNNRIVSSNPVTKNNGSSVLVVDDLQYFDVRVTVDGSGGTADYNIYAKIEVR